MKKTLLTFGVALSISFSSWAGGLLTNTNQHVSFLRNPARGASMEIDAAYTNPAGLAHLPKNGFHFSINNQSAFQVRTITSTFAPFAGYGGNTTKEFDGKASAALIPSIQAAYKTGDWVISGNLAVSGGGGKATFNAGLPSFESQIAMIPLQIEQFAATAGLPLSVKNYSVDAYMEGSSIIYGAQLGGTYSINEMFSVHAGFRMNFVSNSYVGRLHNIRINPESMVPGFGDGSMIAASDYFQALANVPMLESYKPMLMQYAQQTRDKNLDCTQSGWGVTPLVGFNFHWNKLNVGMKYEMRTTLNVENKTKVDDTGLFSDGVNTPHDIPALFTIGVQYDIIDPVTVSIGYHHFFDSDAEMANDKQKFIDGGVNEYLAGIEWRINHIFLISGGGQITRTGVTDKYQADLSYSLNSSTLCIGAAANVTPNVRINVGYLYSFYDDWTNERSDYMGSVPGKDVFARTNKTFGVGVDFRF